jgi:presequence protease
MKSDQSNSTSYPSESYRLIKKKWIGEVNADCVLFDHIKSGARVLKIMADDPNKTFSIAFKTIPGTDAGTPHILEHSVLNGSKNFGVKSPFDLLSKGSLHTFLNAMTYADFTIYPVASINGTDYFNLMHVYLDAVFNPNLYHEPRIFMQEGWHYELTDKEAPIEYKGVVYNEMKGAFSNPERELWYQIQRNLFPGNGYRFSSGGYPTAIPTLTYSDFVNFHKEHYHPSNCYIFLYGDAEMAQELDFIDKEYLCNYVRKVILPDNPLNPPFRAMKKIRVAYPVIEKSSTDQQTFLSMSWVIGQGSDQATLMALDILADVLVNQESAPIRVALREAGIGKDIYSHCQNMQQNILSIVVQNANEGDKEKFRSLVLSTLEKVIAGHIDKESLKGSLNRLEFRFREGDDAQKGLMLNLRSMTGWLFTNDPFPSLEYETHLSQMKKSLTGRYFEERIKNDMLGNPHSLLVTLKPKPGLEKENSKKTAAKLADFRKKRSNKELEDLVNSTNDLMEYQNREDTPEAVATIPVLRLTDISPEAPWYQVTESSTEGILQLYHKEFTNNIVYMSFWFSLRVLPLEMVPYAALLSELLGKMDTVRYSYEELEKSLNMNTGGFNSVLTVFLPNQLDDNMNPHFRIQMKTTPDKLDASIRLLTEILTSTKLNARERLGELLRRLQSQIESSVKQNGYGVTLMRLESYYSRRGAFNDMTRGMEFYWFVTDLVNHFDARPEPVIDCLVKTMNLLFTKGNLITGITCGEEDFTTYSLSMPFLLSSLPVIPVLHNTWSLKPSIKNEGIKTTSKVQYVLQGYDFRKLGLQWNGKWNVLSQILSTDWLQTRIRIIGGAYGGFSGISRNGTIYLASYRDPNLKETFDNFRGSVDFLAGFKADSTTMSRYIIGTIANLDNLLTPSEKGDVAFRRHFENTSVEDIQRDRNSVLATSPEDIRNMSGVIASVLDQQVLCVYGNEEKLKANRDLFKSLVFLQK